MTKPNHPWGPPTLHKRLGYAICSHKSRGHCSDSGRLPHLPDPDRWEATYIDRTGRRHHRNFCAHHAVKFATRHDLMNCL